MLHVVELAAVLLVMVLSHTVLDVAPEVPRRAARNYALWLLGMAAIILLFSIPGIVIWIVRLGMALAAGYVFHWIVSEAATWLGGPRLLPEPSKRALAEAAFHLSGLRFRDCLRVTRHICRRHHPTIALLGLSSCRIGPMSDAAALRQAWLESCEKGLEEARALALGPLADAPDARHSAPDLIFVAQALCVYDARSVERALASLGPNAPAGRARRRQTLDYLARNGKPAECSIRHILFPTTKDRGHALDGVNALTLIWPAAGLARAGFAARAWALGLCFVAATGYGLAALWMNRPVGWVCLAVAGLMHIEGVFAQGDFLLPPGHETETAKGTP